jgi:dipeptidyl aminopeptidase/acylaminoacyl peptidase
MKRASLFLLMVVLTASTAFAQRAMTFEDMAAMRRIGVPQLSPDGKWIAYDASTIDLAANVRKSAIYLVPAAGGAIQQLTDGAKQDEGPAWSPDGRTIAYVSNREGGAKQVYLLDVGTKSSRKLTNLAGGAASIKWSPDGSAVVFTSDVHPDCGVDGACHKAKEDAAAKNPSKARIVDSLLYKHWNAWVEPTRTHIIWQPVNGAAARDLTPGPFNAPHFSVGGGDEFEVSPDGKELVYSSNVDEKDQALSTNSDVFIVPVAGGTAKRLTTRRGADTAPKYSPDGKWIAWRSQERAGYEADIWELWLYNRATGATTRIAQPFVNDIDSVTWAPDSRTMYVTAPENGTSAVYEMTLDGRFNRIPTTGSIHDVVPSRDNKTLYFQMSTLRKPADIYSLTRKGDLRKLTTENDALLGSVAMGETSSVTWTGADNARVQGWLVKPANFDASKKYPAIVLIHGGPQGAWGDAWSYRWNPQMWAARGYAVFMPNPRGSTGFGQPFKEEISGDWGGKVYTDIMNGVDMFAAMPYVDANRMGAAGASYGGYMVNWILGHSDRFKALVSHAGVYNLESMYGVTEELWFTEFEFKGNPWDNPELYTKWSPHRFVKNFKTPTLVTHGELDFRVPVNEGQQLFTALQRRGVPSRLVIFPDEGHWILKPQNSKLWHEQVGAWFDRWLK